MFFFAHSLSVILHFIIIIIFYRVNDKLVFKIAFGLVLTNLRGSVKVQPNFTFILITCSSTVQFLTSTAYIHSRI